VVHPGGTAVLEQVQKELGVSKESLRFSHEVLCEYGNMSSPSVLFVLKRMLEQGPPARGQRGLLLSFGAGFSAHAALVEF
jgi:alkylresorcinol/alkylpyrone synthase